MAEENPPPAPRPLHGWRNDEQAIPGDAGVGKRRRRVVIPLAILAGLITIVMSIVWAMAKPRLPYVVCIPVQEYAYFPFHWFAVEDARAFAGHFDNTRVAYENQERQFTVAALADLRHYRDVAVVVHLNCLAVAQGDQVYLLPADARPLKKASWLTLAEVLDLIEACPAKEKLLVLDIAHGLADARLGILADRVMEQTEKILEKRDLSQLGVFCSCAAGQVALVSEELQQSVFAHYLDEGLAGAADGWGKDGKLNSYITVSEVVAFVTERTDRWAKQNRGLRQTPRVWGKVPDFTLAVAATAKGDGARTVPDVKYPPWLRKGWEKRDEVRAKLGEAYPPQILAAFEAELLRLEKHWRGGFFAAKAGEDGTASKDNADDKMKDLRERIDKDFKFADMDYRVTTLAQAKARFLAKAAALPAGLEEAMRDAVRRIKEPTGKKGEEAEEVSFNFKPGKDEPAPDGAVQAAVLFEVLAELNSPRPRQLKAGQQEIERQLKGKQFVESIWLRRVTDCYVRWEDENKASIWDRLGSAVYHDFQAVSLREDLVVRLHQAPALLPWIRQRLDQADEQRRQAEMLLLSRDQPSQWPRASEQLKNAAKEYGQLLELVTRIAEARKELDRALAVLPGHAMYLAAVAQPRQGEEPWAEARKSAQGLADFFAAPVDAQAPLPLEGESLAHVMRELEKQVTGKADYLVKHLASHGGVVEVEEVQALLASPCLPAARREELWRAGRALRLRLLEETLQEDDRDRQSKPPYTAPVYPPAVDSWPAQTAQASRRASLALDLLTLAGVEGLDPCQRELERASKKLRPQDFDTPGQLLGQLWLEELPKQLGSNPEQVTRLGYLLPLLDTRSEGKTRQHPVAQQRIRQHAELMAWLAESYRAEGKFLAQSDRREDVEASKFFFQAASQSP